jgi:hypothetical protein
MTEQRSENVEPDVTDPKAVPVRNRHKDTPVFDFKRLSEHGVLWLINRVVFHPRGFALALVYSDDDGNVDPIGWRIEGDGTESWRFDGFDEDEKFRAIEGLLAQAREFGCAPHTVDESGRRPNDG